MTTIFYFSKKLSMSERVRANCDEGEEEIFSPFDLFIKAMKDITLILIATTTVNCFLFVPWAQPLPQIPLQLDDKLQGCIFISFITFFICSIHYLIILLFRVTEERFDCHQNITDKTKGVYFQNWKTRYLCAFTKKMNL